MITKHGKITGLQLNIGTDMVTCNIMLDDENLPDQGNGGIYGAPQVGIGGQWWSVNLSLDEAKDLTINKIITLTIE